MATVLQAYAPKNVWRFFEELCAIPHGSGDTKAISDYCAAFAKHRGLRYRQDAANNIIIWKDGSEGYTAHAPVILQGHLDMVCEKEADCTLDFKKDPLCVYVEDGYVRARGTTLGGDDGIAVAYCLALLDAEDIPHPPLEVVLTVDEEIGMLGASAMDVSDLRGRLLLNIDSEDEGVLTVSCAGGATCTITLPLKRQMTEGRRILLRIDGLQGGHSGVDINSGRANADVCMAELLRRLYAYTPFCICALSGGKKDNAIPREAEAELLLPQSTLPEFGDASVEAWDEMKRTVLAQEPSALLTLSNKGDGSAQALDPEQTKRVLLLLSSLPNGVQRMSEQIEGLVQTSLNLGILELTDTQLQLVFSVRSSVNTEKEALEAQLRDTAAAFGASYLRHGEYGAWEYREDSMLRPLMCDVFRQLYGKTPKIEAIHAGLECGIWAEKLPGIDAVSFGPDMTDIHTTRERLSIESVQRTWTYLCAVLARL